MLFTPDLVPDVGGEKRLAARVRREVIQLVAERQRQLSLGALATTGLAAFCAALLDDGILFAIPIAMRVALIGYDRYFCTRLLKAAAAGQHDRFARRAELIGALLLGATWGGMSWPLGEVQLGTDPSLIILLIILYAMVINVASVAPDRPMVRNLMLGYAPMMTAPTLPLLWQGNALPFLATVAGSAGFWLVALRMGRQAEEGVRMRFVNQMLAERLSRTNRRLTESLARVEKLAREDSLTGLLNRRAFEAEATELSAKVRPANAFMLLVDIDFFKAINDRFGHPVGDFALCRVAQCLADTLGPHALCARWGGEEFAACWRADDADDGERRAEDLREAIARLNQSQTADDEWPEQLSLTASLGLARWPAHMGFTEAIKAADTALYRAKDAGRDQVQIAIERRVSDRRK